MQQHPLVQNSHTSYFHRIFVSVEWILSPRKSKNRALLQLHVVSHQKNKISYILGKLSLQRIRSDLGRRAFFVYSFDWTVFTDGLPSLVMFNTLPWTVGLAVKRIKCGQLRITNNLDRVFSTAMSSLENEQKINNCSSETVPIWQTNIERNLFSYIKRILCPGQKNW